MLLVLLARAIVTNPRFEWPVVWHYLFARPILAGLGLTLELTLIATIISLAAGTLLALMRMSANPVLSTAAAVYIWFFRSVPLLVQIIFFYNFSALYPHIELGMPDFGPSFGTVNVNAIISPFVAALLGLGFNESATRPRRCAAASCRWMPGSGRPPISGLQPGADRPLRRSAAGHRVFLPPFGNQVVNLLKLTSLVSIVALADLLYSAQLGLLLPDIRDHSAADRRLDLVSRRRIHPLVLPEPNWNVGWRPVPRGAPASRTQAARPAEPAPPERKASDVVPPLRCLKSTSSINPMAVALCCTASICSSMPARSCASSAPPAPARARS